MQHVPMPIVQHLAQLKDHQQDQQRQSALVLEKQLMERLKMQWRPELGLLNYFNVEVAPREPMTWELTHYPGRSRYYEIFVCTWTFAFSILLLHSLEYLASTLCARCFRNMAHRTRRISVVQFLLLVVPFQISVVDYPVKNYPKFVLPFNCFCLFMYLLCLVHKRFIGKVSNSLKLIADDNRFVEISIGQSANSSQRKPLFNDLLSIYRSVVYISTAVCIFARDQPCWNNDFSKTYSFGTGLMDVGVGCFVVCIGSLGPTAIRQMDTVDKSQSLRKAALQAAILTACGLVKTLLVQIITKARGVQFDESWREYGVHWNAFYSLGVARILGTCLELQLLPKRCPPLLAAVAVAAAHECLLSMGVAEYVLAPEKPEPYNRSNLIGQNREGLASVSGLITLYLAGLQLGRWARDWTSAEADGDARRATLKFLALLIGALAWRPVMFHSGGWLLPESRRLMNPSYCVWVVAFSCYCILFSALGLWARELLNRSAVSGHQLLLEGNEAVKVPGTPLHLRQVDSAGLLYFLISNLLTGLFNFSVDHVVKDKESLDGPACFLIVLVYTAAVFLATRIAETKLSFRLLQDKLMLNFCR